MRIALLTNNVLPAREGIGRHVTEIGRRLRARGHEILLLARGEAFGGWRESEVEGLRVRHFPFWPVRPLHQAATGVVLRRWLDAGADGAQLLHVHLPLLPPLPCRLPIVVTVHSPMLADTAAIREPGLKPRLIRANAQFFSRGYEQWHLDHARSVIAVSAGVAEELRAGYRLRRRGPLVIENGVDTGLFGFRPAGPRAPEILYVGRLGYRKGLRRLLGAFARLHAARPELRLVLAGEGPLRSDLETSARRQGIRGRVEFAGFLDPAAVRDRLHRAACFVNPADYESGPLTLLEAMAAGTPVVTTRTGLVGAMGGAPPLRVAEPSEMGIAAAVAEVLADPAATACRVRAARELVESRFGWDRAVDRLAAVYEATTRRAA
jgi:glycosyltransferase involved in cell wall biosynthesis